MMGRLKAVAQGAGGGLFAGAGVLALYLIADAYVSGASAGDWLSFAGVIVGVAGTILATMWIEHWREARTHRRARDEAIFALDQWADTMKELDQNRRPVDLAEIRKLHSYLTLLAADFSPAQRHAVRMANLFWTEVPGKVDELDRALKESGPEFDSWADTLINDIAGYGIGMRLALED